MSLVRIKGYLCRDAKTNIYWVDAYDARRTPKRLTRSTKADTLALAQKRAREIYTRWQGEDPQTGDKPKYTFGEVTRELLDQYEAKFKAGKIRLGTFENARMFFRRLADEFGYFRLDEIDIEWRRFEARFRRENPGKILYNHWKHLSLIMNYAYKTGQHPRPFTIENPDPKRSAGRALNDDEKTALVAAAEGDLRDQLAFSMTMGMRLREHLKLAWDRVDFKENTISLRAEDTKTHKPRVMQMTPDVREVLERRWAQQQAHDWTRSPYVFPSATDRKKPANQNKTAWRTAKKRAGIRGRLRYHDLRHTFLTDCAKKVRAGEISVTLVCAYAGLLITVFERIYLHLNHKDTAAVSGMVALNLRGQSPAKAVFSV